VELPEPDFTYAWVGFIIAGLIGLWVAQDAYQRGKALIEAFAWGVGVFALLLVVLPIYLYIRPRRKVRE